MQHFLAVFTGTPEAFARSGWPALSEAERQAKEREGMAAWGAWVQKHAEAIVDGGGPLGRTKRISAEGVADISNALAGYTVVRAESHEAAAQMFVGHPHFTHFPGDAVELMPVLPIPKL
jgi:hypothetical protein